jgi:hypothetical protein
MKRIFNIISTIVFSGFVTSNQELPESIVTHLKIEPSATRPSENEFIGPQRAKVAINPEKEPANKK